MIFAEYYLVTWGVGSAVSVSCPNKEQRRKWLNGTVFYTSLFNYTVSYHYNLFASQVERY